MSGGLAATSEGRAARGREDAIRPENRAAGAMAERRAAGDRSGGERDRVDRHHEMHFCGARTRFSSRPPPSETLQSLTSISAGRDRVKGEMKKNFGRYQFFL